MLEPPSDSKRMSFRSSQFPAAQRLGARRHLLNKWLIETEIRQTENSPFHGTAYLRALQDLRFGWGRFGGMLYQRSRTIASQDNDDLFLVVNLKGALVVSHCGRESDIGLGGACLMSCSEAGAYRWPEDMEVLSIRTNFDSVSALVRNVYDCIGWPIAPENDGLRLLIGYIRLLEGSEPLAATEAWKLATRHLADLLALALGARGDAGELAQQRSVPAARRKTVEAYIERNLGRPDLSPAAVARHVRISTRTVQRLFECEDTSFTDFLLARRLARAHAVLGDLRTTGRTISDIALSCGFGNISYFNRQFRLRYQATPSDVKFRDALCEVRAKPAR